MIEHELLHKRFGFDSMQNAQSYIFLFLIFLVATIFTLSRERTDFTGSDMEFIFRAFIQKRV